MRLKWVIMAWLTRNPASALHSTVYIQRYNTAAGARRLHEVARLRPVQASARSQRGVPAPLSQCWWHPPKRAGKPEGRVKARRRSRRPWGLKSEILHELDSRPEVLVEDQSKRGSPKRKSKPELEGRVEAGSARRCGPQSPAVGGLQRASPYCCSAKNGNAWTTTPSQACSQFEIKWLARARRGGRGGRGGRAPGCQWTWASLTTSFQHLADTYFWCWFFFTVCTTQENIKKDEFKQIYTLKMILPLIVLIAESLLALDQNQLPRQGLNLEPRLRIQ